MEGLVPPAKGLIIFRIAVWRLLLNWLLLLRYWASKHVHPMEGSPPVELSSRRKFLSQTFELQEKMRQTFAPFHRLCATCMESCCWVSEGIPYDAVDSVLYDIYPDSVSRQAPMALNELLTVALTDNFLQLIIYLKRLFRWQQGYPQGQEKFQEPRPDCPALTGKGCSLPWGQRPGICVFWTCKQVLTEMNWREYWRYIWISGRYCLHLTVSLLRVVAEWRYQQRVYALKTDAAQRVAPW
jgi:hypothetical protein